jgi:aspartate aminotransferase
MNLSSRVSRIGESATLKVSRLAGELRASGVEVVNLSAGEPDFPSPPVVVAAAKRALDEGLTRYTPAAGLPALREALAEKYRRLGAPWEASQVVVAVGAKAALIELVMALFDEGDEVILPSPFWVSFPEQLKLAGAVPVEVVARPEEGFLLRAEPVIEALTDKTRGIILNSPCNPTGGIIEADPRRWCWWDRSPRPTP